MYEFIIKYVINMYNLTFAVIAYNQNILLYITLRYLQFIVCIYFTVNSIIILYIIYIRLYNLQTDNIFFLAI